MTELSSSELTTSSTLNLTRSIAGTSATAAAGRRTRQRHQQHGERPRHRDGADKAAGDRAGQQLALGADVPELGPEGDRDGEPGEDHRCGAHQRLGDGVAVAEGKP